jgi:parvulin-like peptidyl-prolyl isomerase
MTKVVKINPEEILNQIRLSYKMPEVIEGIKNRKLVEDQAQELGLTLEEEELQKAADKFRIMYQLHKAHDTLAWLEKNHLSLEDFEELVYNHALSTKLAVHLFADKIEPYFFEHQLDYAGVVMYEVILDDEDLALELFYAIQSGEMSFYDVAHEYIQDEHLRRQGGYRGILNRKDLKPEISAAVFSANCPQLLKPIITSKGVHLIFVEKIIPPKLDNALRNIIAASLFQQWIEQNSGQIEITL